MPHAGPLPAVDVTHAQWCTTCAPPQLMAKISFKRGSFEVDATLCDHLASIEKFIKASCLSLSDHLADFHNFTEKEFGFEANTCKTHFLGITAAQYTHRKYFKLQEN